MYFRQKEGYEMQKLALFDMDGTLLIAHNKSEKSRFQEAIERVCKRSINITFNKEGMTDLLILQKLCEIYHISFSKIEELKQALEDIFREKREEYDIEILPGIEELLNLFKDKNILMGLVTGALRKTTRLKLKRARILNFFSIVVSGSDPHLKRSDLVNLALCQAKIEHGFTRQKDNIFVFGDTPHDIIAGKETAVKTIAIATGSYSLKDLAAKSPDLLVSDLDTGKDKVLQIMALA